MKPPLANFTCKLVTHSLGCVMLRESGHVLEFSAHVQIVQLRMLITSYFCLEGVTEIVKRDTQKKEREGG